MSTQSNRIRAVALGLGLVVGFFALLLGPLLAGMAAAAGWELASRAVLERLKVMGVVLGLGTVGLLGIRLFLRWLTRVLGERVPKRLQGPLWVGFVSVLLLVLLVAMVRSMYQNGVGQGVGLKSARDRLTSGGAGAVASELAEQSERLRAVSEESRRLLGSLDRTQFLISKARQDLGKMMSATSGQLASVDSARISINGLMDRESLLRQQTGELSRILGGHAPVSKDDLDRASRDSLTGGFLVGVASSLVAAFLLGGGRLALTKLWNRLGAWAGGR